MARCDHSGIDPWIGFLSLYEVHKVIQFDSFTRKGPEREDHRSRQGAYPVGAPQNAQNWELVSIPLPQDAQNLRGEPWGTVDPTALPPVAILDGAAGITVPLKP